MIVGMSRDTLELIDPNGVRVKVAEFIFSDPFDEDGVKFQKITITILPHIIPPAALLRVVDAAENDRFIVAFNAESSHHFFGDDNIVRVEGKHYLSIPKDSK